MSRDGGLLRRGAGAQVRRDLRRHGARRRAFDCRRARGRRVQRRACDVRPHRSPRNPSTQAGLTASATGARKAGEEHIEARARFDYVRYANCWEDADVLAAALEPGPAKRILSIASGGDNSFALAADGATVVSVDLSE